MGGAYFNLLARGSSHSEMVPGMATLGASVISTTLPVVFNELGISSLTLVSEFLLVIYSAFGEMIRQMQVL
jgi:hypothetical protein